MKKRSLLSLFDHSGQWSKPYRDAGWTVVQVDIKNGQDVMQFDYSKHAHFDGILAAPPVQTSQSQARNTGARRMQTDGRSKASCL